VRRLTGDEHLSAEFATEWRTYELDEKTRTLLDYVEKLTKSPYAVDDSDFEALRHAGWDERGIYEASALASFFNFTGRLEAAAGLPPDEIPVDARPPEAKADT